MQPDPVGTGETEGRPTQFVNRCVRLLVVLVATVTPAVGQQVETADPELERFLASFAAASANGEALVEAKLQLPPGVTLAQLQSAFPGLERLPGLAREIGSLARQLETAESGAERRAIQMRLLGAIAELSALSAESDPKADATLGFAMMALATSPEGLGLSAGASASAPIAATSEEQRVGARASVNGCGWFPSQPSLPDWLTEALRVAGIDLAEDCTDECTGLLDAVACFDNDGGLEDAVDGLCETLDAVCGELLSLRTQVAAIPGFVKSFNKQVTQMSTDIGNLATLVGGEFDRLPGLVEAGINSALTEATKLVPDDPETLLAVVDTATGVDMNDPEWWNDLLGPGLSTPLQGAQLDVLAPECPSEGTEIPLIGEVGTAHAEYWCKNTRELWSELFGFIPGDTALIKLKIAGGTVFYPIDYLCQCVEATSKIRLTNETRGFHDHAAENLDVQVTTLASQMSVDALRSTLVGIGDEGDRLALSLDILGGQLQELGAGQGDHELMLDALRGFVDRLAIETELAGDDDDSDAPQADETLFMLPESAGGKAEQVRAVVADVMARTEAAGLAIGSAERLLARGDAAYQVEDYRRAYAAYRKAYRQVVEPDVDDDGDDDSDD